MSTLLAITLCLLTGEETHLFILSGQSNMAGLKPEASFTPAVTKAFEGKNVLVVKDAIGGQPIRRWYKKWKPEGGTVPEGNGDLYDRLMKKVKAAIKKCTSLVKSPERCWRALESYRRLKSPSS